MDTPVGEGSPPKSTDLDGWRRAVADGSLRLCLFPGTLKLWVAANVGLATFIREVNFGLVQWCTEQVVSYQFDAGSSNIHQTRPIKPKRVAACNPVVRTQRQKFSESKFLSAIEHVALVFGDNQSKPRNLRRKVAQFNAAKIRKRNIGVKVGFAAPLVDLDFNHTHFLVRDNKEITGTASRIEHPDLRHPLAKVEQGTGIGARLGELRAQVVKEKRVEHFQNVRNAGVVHPKLAALFVLGDGLNHRPKNVRIDLGPVEIADV